VARTKGRAEVERKNEALQALTIEYVGVDDVEPNDYNANRQSDREFELLCRSITEDGFTQPVIVGQDGKIVDGEHRWRAARHLGHGQIPIVRVPMDAAQARIATLRHNRARGSEDLELSVEILRDLEKLGALDWAADSLMIDDTELQRLLEDVPTPEALAQEIYSEAWIPETARAETPYEADGGATRADLTQHASDLLRDRERRMREAHTEEERRVVAAERSRVYRLALTFSNDEAYAVRTILGDTPAASLLTLCRAEMERRGLPLEEPEEAPETTTESEPATT
jgi:ParB-like chromosome segregation protein Spo0J